MRLHEINSNINNIILSKNNIGTFNSLKKIAEEYIECYNTIEGKIGKRILFYDEINQGKITYAFYKNTQQLYFYKTDKSIVLRLYHNIDAVEIFISFNLNNQQKCYGYVKRNCDKKLFKVGQVEIEYLLAGLTVDLLNETILPEELEE